MSAKLPKKTVWNMISPHLRPKKHWKHETLTESVFSSSPSFVFARLQTWPSSPANSMNDRYHHFLSHDSSGIRMEITKKLKDFSNEKKGLCFLATRTRSWTKWKCKPEKEVGIVKINPARDPKQCGGGRRIMCYYVDDVDVDDDDDDDEDEDHVL